MNYTLPIVKAIHVFSIISWMAGLLYLPRLFVYHAELSSPNDIRGAMLQRMEERLMHIIMLPALAGSLATGLILLTIMEKTREGWLLIKLLCVGALILFHYYCTRWRKAFANDKNRHSARFFRIINEIPAILMAIILTMVMIRPF